MNIPRLFQSILRGNKGTVSRSAVEGMNCANCVQQIEKALASLPGIKSFALLALLAGAISSAVVGCKTHEHMEAASSDSYPLTKCVVSGEDLRDKPYVLTTTARPSNSAAKTVSPSSIRNPTNTWRRSPRPNNHIITLWAAGTLVQPPHSAEAEACKQFLSVRP